MCDLLALLEDDQDDVLAVAATAGLSKAITFPGPSRRSARDHQHLGIVMREAKRRCSAERDVAMVVHRSTKHVELFNTSHVWRCGELLQPDFSQQHQPGGACGMQQLTVTAALRVAFSDFRTFSDRARFARISRPYAVCVCRAVAEAGMQMQSAILDEVRRSGRPLACISIREWDETQQTMSVQHGSGVARPMAPHVLVQRSFLRYVFENGSWQDIPLVCPPRLVPSTSADAVHAAFERNSSVAPSPAALGLFARIVLCVNVADSARSNKSLVNREAALLPDNAASTSMWCNLHQGHLAALEVIDVKFGSVTADITTMYSTAVMLRQGRDFLAMVAAVEAVVAARLDYRQGAPPPEHWPTSLVLAGVALQCNPDKEEDDIERLLNPLVELLNGDWREETLTHWCQGCCEGPNDCAGKLRRCIVASLFRRRPTPPTRARWTRTDKCLEDFVLGRVCHDLYAQCARVAFGVQVAAAELADADGKRGGRGSGAGDGVNLGETMREEYSRAIGMRKRRFLEWCRDKRAISRIITLALTLRPVRYVMAWLLKYQATPLPESPGLLCDFVSPCLSPITVAQQHLSAMFALRTQEVRVFLDAYPGQENMQRLGRQILAASAALHWRMTMPLAGWPWKLALVVDARLPLQERLDVASDAIAISRQADAPHTRFLRLLREAAWPWPSVFGSSERLIVALGVLHVTV